jgi:hypothetical protein
MGTGLRSANGAPNLRRLWLPEYGTSQENATGCSDSDLD